MQKTAIITGGTSGIGKAFVLKYAHEGYAVIFTGRNTNRLEEIKASLGSHPHLGLLLDASKKKETVQLVEQTLEKFGQIDVVVCNAGISMRAMFEDLKMEAFEEVMRVNFYGSVYLTKYTLPYLLKTKGSLIAISSINGYRATPARSAYCASKFAMQGFFESIRTEVMKRGVDVLVVCPGFTQSNIRKVALNSDGKAQGESPRNEKKMMTADEVAQRTFKAMQKKQRDLILTRQGKLAVFLNKFIPSILDHIVYNMMKKEQESPLK